MNLVDYLHNVKDKETFIKFVSRLIENKENFANEWESSTIEDYLESASQWLDDSGREDISWKLMAEFLYCGKIYE